MPGTQLGYPRMSTGIDPWIDRSMCSLLRALKSTGSVYLRPIALTPSLRPTSLTIATPAGQAFSEPMLQYVSS